MNRIRQYWLIVMFCCLTSVSAQQTSELTSVPAQVSIIYPMGTHGRQSPHNTYNFSLNLLTGKIGGLSGLEISGLYGQVKNNALGIQVAGLGNTVDGKMNGIQVSGLANVIGDGMAGLQVSGLANVIGDGITGLQVSGLANVIGDGMKGLQVSGLANVVGDEIKGLQVSGITNVVGEEMKGLQVSGLVNVVGSEMKGVQISLYNRVHTSKGLQIGLVSVNDTIATGASLSLINIVKKGAYREWELSFSDYANAALSYKMGTQKFYTLYTAGVNFIEDKLWVFGVGFGNRTPIGSRFDFRPELVFDNYFPTNFKNIQSTFSTHLKLGFVYSISEKFGLSLAPSVYVMNAEKRNSPDSEFYKISPFGALYTNDKGNKQTTIGVGISLGLSLK